MLSKRVSRPFLSTRPLRLCGFGAFWLPPVPWADNAQEEDVKKIIHKGFCSRTGEGEAEEGEGEKGSWGGG